MDPRAPGPQAGRSGEGVTELEQLIAFHCSEARISMWCPKAALATASGSLAVSTTRPFSRSAQMEREKLNPLLFLLP